MAGTFLDMYTRITTELRRSNATADVKQAINDAILEAANDRFTFNEMVGQTFATIANQEYYPDLNFTDVDAMWYLNGTSRFYLDKRSQIELDDLAFGNPAGGQLYLFSHFSNQFRLYPIPTTVITLYLNGYGTLSPYPLVNDADTNDWLIKGEQYIRALAKRNYIRDVARDFNEARTYEAIAQGYRDQLLERHAIKSSTGNIRATQF